MKLIHIRGLEVEVRIGVPAEERAMPQVVKVDLEMTPCAGFDEMEDDVDRTIDYHRVCQEVQALGASGEWKLIETFASEIGDLVIKQFGALRTRVLVRKFILAETEWVGVECTREP